MFKVSDKEISQPIQHNKEGKILNNNLMNTRSTPSRFTRELDGDIILQQVRLHPRSGSRTMNGSRNKVEAVGDLQPGLNSKMFKVEIISVGKPVASRQGMIPTNSFYFVQEVVFRLPATFNSQAIDGMCQQNTFSDCMYRRRHFVSTSHMMLHAHAWLKLKNCVPNTFVHSISCSAPCLTTCTVHPAFCPLIHLPLLLSFFHWLRLKVDHVQNTLRRFTRP